MKILLSDTHFGCRQNSVTWTDYQMKFFYDQLIPFIKQQNEPVYLYHLGDVFDIRSTVNLLVAERVHRLFEDLKAVCKQIIIIGGNHDYYSPNENEANINSLRLVLDDLVDQENTFVIVDKENYEKVDEHELFVPWFRYYDYDKLVEKLQDNKTFKHIFVHNDLTVTLEGKYKTLFRKCNVYSGHIHIPNHTNNLHTLGSVFALTFADANSDRGFYTMNDDGSDFTFHTNTESIRFFRLYNQDIFRDDINIQKDDYVELYIDQCNLLKDSYVEQIKTLAKRIHNFVTIPHNELQVSNFSTDFKQYDITDVCRQNIPEHLIEKFNKICNIRE